MLRTAARLPSDVLKNELAAGVLPGGGFGANAAGRRLDALTHNLVTAMKRLVLPPERLRARPQRLRFLVFTQPGKFVSHARRLKLRLMRAWRRFSTCLGVRSVAAAGAGLTADGSRVFSSAAGGPAELRPRAAPHPRMGAGPPRQAARDILPARGPRRLPSPGAPSEPEDTLRPSSQIPLPLTDGLGARR